MCGQRRRTSREVAGALEIVAGQHDEERRRIDAAVIAAERHLAEPAISPRRSLVQDLPGLGIGRRIGLGRLVGGQIGQHAARDLGSTQSICSAVMIASRPNTVLYQGMPA